ncbi:MBL fold metallo-hydrolase [Rhizorhabdus wittichii]|uniref:MBL fold metallo-hydrolase n=1 Tax=Rhizorhabdus wittichii TaxID=160791 RepID=A0A975D6F7_9SPHN|nr:alkyl sulfatase dimerization domain-containing protein [Rhizorhabdus wittichii]QTH23887.1 MBL fold metallo-hydrolase [Rhizorhabdus wittichii]
MVKTSWQRGNGLFGKRRVLGGTALAASLLVGWHGPVHAGSAFDRLPKPPSAATVERLAEVERSLPLDDREDFDFAARGFIAPPLDPQIRNASGEVVRDLTGYGLYAGSRPASVNPSLWRQAQVMGRPGLYQVTPSVFQVRGMDLANMTVILGKTGYILVDPLMATEAAAAALKLVRARLGDRPVTGIILTHSHPDHYGGTAGVLTEAQLRDHSVPVLAPGGFSAAALSENVVAGPAMSRRNNFMFGMYLPFGAQGAVSYGLGPAFKGGLAKGTISFVPPTEEISEDGARRTIDGVDIEFMITPDAEAPSELMFHLPGMRVLCGAEILTATIHNVQTLRGAPARDARKWAEYIDVAMKRFGDRTDALVTSHFWPRFGQAKIGDYLRHYRNAYAFMHDQTARLMNDGYTPTEIAERMALPADQSRHWYNRENYGTLRHNSKGIYDRYLGWFDANPSNLDPLPPEQSAPRYVEAMGGHDRAMKIAAAAVDGGEYRWAAELLKQIVFADPARQDGRYLLADAYEQLGYQAESATWRNFYLTGAQELRSGAPTTAYDVSGDFLQSLPLTAVLDVLATRIDPARIVGQSVEIGLRDGRQAELVTIEDGVLTHRAITPKDAPRARVSGDTRAIVAMLLGKPVAASTVAQVEGDRAAVELLRGALASPIPNFNIVTP